MAIWLIRAGRDGEYEQKFIQEKRVYVTRDYLDIDLLKFAEWQELRAAMTERYPYSKPRAIGGWASQAWSFAHEIKQGDLIVLPLKSKRAIQIGEVTGDYHFDLDGSNPYFHWRSVNWIAEAVPRAYFGEDLLKTFGANMTICHVQNNNAEARIAAMRSNGWKPETIKARTIVTTSQDSVNSRITKRRKTRDSMPVHFEILTPAIKPAPALSILPAALDGPERLLWNSEDTHKQAKETLMADLHEPILLVDSKDSVAEEKAPYEIIKVFFGTDRKLIEDAKSPRDYFNEDRGRVINYGTCEVSIPIKHQTGELETPTFKIFESPKKHIVLMRINLCNQNQFISDLRCAGASSKENTALIFVHGFNNTFEDAARRTAQIAKDTEFAGVPMFYSWPSGGNAIDYVPDGSDVRQAISYLKEFLKDIAENSQFTSVTLLAHSMGSHALTQAFLDMKGEIDTKKLQIFKEIILAAPDIDADEFKNRIAPALIKSKPTLVTLYASSNDKALIYSKKRNGGSRAGDSGAGLVLIQGIETIDATNVNTNLYWGWGLGHTYIAESREVLSDIHYLIQENLRANSRFGLEPLPNTGNPRYWKFKP